MKIYQLIYTAAEHGLSDPELGLKNTPGLSVYSCSQGLTRENINEIVRFCSYHLPDNTDVSGAKNYGDTNIPDRFPKTYRTFELSDGKKVALQSVYSGVDSEGKQGNFFTHALIFDECDGIITERYYKSKTFKKFLTKEETDRELVTYLPKLESADSSRNLTKSVEEFIKDHKKQMTVLFEGLMSVLVENDKNHMMIASSNSNDVDMYILSLKYVLPKCIAISFGISTYNIYIPSNSQNKIILHGTIKGKNNISDGDIESHPNCVYVDADKIDKEKVTPMKIFDKGLKELYNEYELYNIKTAEELKSYAELDDIDNVAELSGKLSVVKDKLGADAFKKQCIDIFDNIDDDQYNSVRFEILDIMCSYITLFNERKEKIAKKYIICGLRSICSGNSVNIEKIFGGEYSDSFKEDIINSLPEYMNMISSGSIDKKSGMLILRILAMLKSITGRKYWKDFFNNNEEYMKEFVRISADVVIDNTVPVTFTAPQIWSKTDLSEVVAYFDSSTSDNDLKNGCRKYILSNTDEEWGKLGITLKTTKKNSVESAKDIMRIRKLLSQVGYLPFTRKQYRDIKYQISEEMDKNDNPLMVARLLNEVYIWQGAEGQLNESKLAAEKIYDLIMELKEMELSCYNYIFPKLGIEIMNSPGHYHEVIINADTMEPEFWNWYLLAYSRIQGDENIRLTYQMVYEASSRYLKNVAVKERLDSIINKKDN